MKRRDFLKLAAASPLGLIMIPDKAECLWHDIVRKHGQERCASPAIDCPHHQESSIPLVYTGYQHGLIACCHIKARLGESVPDAVRNIVGKVAWNHGDEISHIELTRRAYEHCLGVNFGWPTRMLATPYLVDSPDSQYVFVYGANEIA